MPRFKKLLSENPFLALAQLGQGGGGVAPYQPLYLAWRDRRRDGREPGLKINRHLPSGTLLSDSNQGGEGRRSTETFRYEGGS
jgi:hypothetical protein